MTLSLERLHPGKGPLGRVYFSLPSAQTSEHMLSSEISPSYRSEKYRALLKIIISSFNVFFFTQNNDFVTRGEEKKKICLKENGRLAGYFFSTRIK